MTYDEYLRAVILARLKSYKGDVERASVALNMKPREVRRWLKAEGLTVKGTRVVVSAERKQS